MKSAPLALDAQIERWPIAGSFTISRGAKTEAVVVTVRLSRGNLSGRGECTPYARYGETPEATLAAIRALEPVLNSGLDRERLATLLPAGAARNALDCALWDLEAKEAGERVTGLLGLEPTPVITAYTISLGTPESMAEAAAKAAQRPLLKIKLGGDGDIARLKAVRAAAPDSELIVDANEAWTAASLEAHLAACAETGVTLIEQPLPADNDHALGSVRRIVPVCADASVHDRASLPGLTGRYDAINIKLDKTGGLTEALAMAASARALGLDIMVGCMVATSLSMAPAMMIAQGARVVDLDGPLLLAKDRDHGLRYDGSTVHPPTPALWG